MWTTKLAGVCAALLLVGCAGDAQPETVTVTHSAAPAPAAAETTDPTDPAVEMMRETFDELGTADQESVCRLWAADMDNAYDRLVESGTDVPRDSFDDFVAAVC